MFRKIITFIDLFHVILRLVGGGKLTVCITKSFCDLKGQKQRKELHPNVCYRHYLLFTYKLHFIVALFAVSST